MQILVENSKCQTMVRLSHARRKSESLAKFPAGERQAVFPRTGCTLRNSVLHRLRELHRARDGTLETKPTQPFTEKPDQDGSDRERQRGRRADHGA